MSLRRPNVIVVDRTEAVRLENGAVEVTLRDTHGRRTTLYLHGTAKVRMLLDAVGSVYNAWRRRDG